MSRATATKKKGTGEKSPVPANLIRQLSVTSPNYDRTTRDYPDPDLLIRTGGELRVSNFLLWQMAYTEFYFTELLWPDFRHEDFYEAVAEYQRRQRRFGKTGAQVEGA